MSADSLSKGIKEGICDVLGRKSRFQLIKIFQLEVKPQKLEARVVVLTEYKLHIIVPKLPVKLEQSIHFLNITSLDSPSYSKVVIGTESKSLTLNQMEDGLSDVQQLIYCIADTLIMVFPCLLGMVMGRLSLAPASRVQDLMERLQELQSRDCVPCGRFSFAYHCMCDYHGLTFFEEIAWDVDTIYMSHSSKDLNLNDFDHLDIRYLIPVISALIYNDWFTKLSISNMKLSVEAISEVVRALETNCTLEEIVLANVGLKWESVQRIAASLNSNTEISICSLDVSGNLIEDKGLTCLLPVIEKMTDSLTTLNLSRTGVTSKGVNKFASSLIKHRQFCERLKVLDLSENSLKPSDLTCFYSFLSQPNSLTRLNLANTDCSLDLVMGCLATGCIYRLAHLDLSHNVYSSSSSRKCAKTALLSWQQFFSGSGALQSVNVAGTKLPAEVLKSILLGLSQRDCQTQSLELNLSANAFGSAGAEVLQSSISNISCISSLDISDNGFDQSLAKVLLSIAKNRHIKKLAVGKNLTGAKPKHVLQSVKALVQIITDDNLPLECLSIEDLKLKRDIALFLNALCGNNSLTELDISGNQLGDTGARILSKVLLVNRKLTCLHWDHNNVTAAGFSDIATALQRNHTLKVMPVPVNDVASSLRINQEKTEQAVQQIELLLHRNSGPQKLDCDQSFKLRQVLLVNSTQQVMDQLILRLQNVISQLETKCLSEETQEEISHALGLIKDASASRNLLLELQTLSKSLQDPDGPVPQKLNSVAVDLQSTMLQKFKALVSDMFKYLEVQCPIVFNSRTADSAKSLTSQLSELPNDFVRDLIKDHLEIEVFNKLNELNFVVAGVLCNKVMEEVILALDKAHKSLKYALKCESRTDGVAGPATLRSRPAKAYDSGSVSSSVSDESTSESHSESLQCVQLMQKALRSRHLRPTSHVGPVPTVAGHFGSGVEDTEDDNNSGSTTPFKTQSTPALLVPAGQSGEGKSSETDCRPPVPVFRKRKGFAQATSASFEVILDGDSASRDRTSDGALPKFGSDLVRLRKERHSWRTPEVPLKKTEVSYMRRSSDTFLYQTPSPTIRQTSFVSPNKNTLTVGPPLPGNVKGSHGNGGASSQSRKSFESSSNQLSLLSAMLATSAASIAMITIQKASSSSSSLNRSVEQDLSRTSATDMTRTDEGGDYSTTESQTAASVTDSDIVIEDDVYASTPFIEESRPIYSATPTYYSCFPEPVHLSSELLHPTKDRPKHPKTRSSSRRSVFTCRAFLERGQDEEDSGDVLSPSFLSSKGKTAARVEQDTAEIHQSGPLRSQKPITATKSPQVSSRKEVCPELHDFSWDRGEIGALPISPRNQNSSRNDSRQHPTKFKTCCPPESPVTEKDDEEKGKKLDDIDQMSSKSRLPPTPAPKPSKKSPKKDTFD